MLAQPLQIQIPKSKPKPPPPGPPSRQKMANRQHRSQISPSPSTVELRIKLTKLISRHEQLKISYHQLKSQINTGLLEAEEVFASLSIPLIKLVGLKSVENAKEGRFSTIIIDDSNHRRNGVATESPVAGGAGVRKDQISGFEGETFAVRAAIVGKELMEKRRMQFIQLVKLLRQIETKVNLSQDDILQNLDDHYVRLRKFFEKAVHYVSTIDSENHDTILITVKLLQAIFCNVTKVLRSVKDGVEELIQGLSQQMCNPMVEYVKGLNDDIKNGTSMQLLAMVEKMVRIMKDGRVELEDARNKARLAEEGKIEALCKLKETIERVRKMQEHLIFLSEAKGGLAEASFSHKLLGMEEDQAKDDKLLWEILKTKRKRREPESPMGPEARLYFDATKEHHKSNRVKPSVNCAYVKRSRTRGLSPQTPFLNTRIPLGSSPSVVNQKVVSLKLIAS